MREKCIAALNWEMNWPLYEAYSCEVTFETVTEIGQ